MIINIIIVIKIQNKSQTSGLIEIQGEKRFHLDDRKEKSGHKHAGSGLITRPDWKCPAALPTFRKSLVEETGRENMQFDY
jgi:hypothetical protein